MLTMPPMHRDLYDDAHSVQASRPGTAASSCSQSKRRTPCKPAWALSKDEHETVEEEEELDLLDFADNLDFDSFVSKMDDVDMQDAFKVRHSCANGAAPLQLQASRSWTLAIQRPTHLLSYLLRLSRSQKDRRWEAGMRRFGARTLCGRSITQQ